MNKHSKPDRRLTLNKITVLKLTDLQQVSGGASYIKIGDIKGDVRRA